MFRLHLVTCSLLFGVAITPPSAHAALVLDYEVVIVDSMGNDLPGPVTVGTEIFWEINAVISGMPSGSNFGIASLSVGLKDSSGETLSPGTVGGSFSGYTLTGGGVFIDPALRFIGVQQDTQGASTVGDGVNPGSFLLASGSYTVTQVGLRTLEILAPLGLDRNSYFTAAMQIDNDASDYDQVTFGSDTIQVNSNAVPEPSSLALMGLAACGAMGLRLRRRKLTQRGRPQSP